MTNSVASCFISVQRKDGREVARGSTRRRPWGWSLAARRPPGLLRCQHNHPLSPAWLPGACTHKHTRARTQHSHLHVHTHSHASGPQDERGPAGWGGGWQEGGRRGGQTLTCRPSPETVEKGQCQSCARKIVHFIKPVFIKKPIHKVWKA